MDYDNCMKFGSIGTSAHGGYDVAHVHTTHEADCDSPGRAYSSVLLLLAIASLLIVCGGGGARQAGSSGSSTSATDLTSSPYLVAVPVKQ
jgi:hypothetical protein